MSLVVCNVPFLTKPLGLGYTWVIRSQVNATLVNTTTETLSYHAALRCLADQILLLPIEGQKSLRTIMLKTLKLQHTFTIFLPLTTNPNS